MTAILSTTHDPLYQFFLPITTWCWNQLGVRVLCFIPQPKDDAIAKRYFFVTDTMINNRSLGTIAYFDAPEHKEATYAQCSRLFGGCMNYRDEEVLIVGDIDMLMFRIPEMQENGFSIFGADLVPENQFPMCYISSTSKNWKDVFKTDGRTLQQCLDDLIGDKDSISMRSDFWSLDQNEAYFRIKDFKPLHLINRTNGVNQFATKRLDRDDYYILDRLNNEIYDYHANRPGYEDANFNKIISVLTYYYPEKDFTWLHNYKNQYLCLI